MSAPPRSPGANAPREAPGPRMAWGYLVAAALLALAAGLWFWTSWTHQAAPASQPGTVTAAPSTGQPARPDAAALSNPSTVPAASQTSRPTTHDPDDLAAHVPAGQAPSMVEVIQRLHQAGVHTGLGAFNPPGTSPPLVGLAVPPDFPLPDGYVRHHQTTDDGQDIEPILMFAPDRTFYDRSGRAIELPKDRVVPPEWAPPGLPIRRVVVPPPLPPGKPGS